jgi:transcriptional regulator with XRE-family HTH domain
VAEVAARQEWLHVAQTVASPPDGSDVGEVIRWYRKRERLTQHEAAARLNTTQSRLSKLESGAQTLRDVDELRHIAHQLGIPPERLGVLPDRSGDAVPQAAHVTDRPGPIRDSQEHWRRARGQLNANRAALGDLASELYPQAHRVPDTTVLAKPGWLPEKPVDLADLQLAWRTHAEPPHVTGKVAESSTARPLMADLPL